MLAFADEFGTHSLDFTKEGTHFIVAAVICKNENLEKLRAGIEEIRRKHKFQTGEIKSQKVGPNHRRRKQVLEDIARLEISVYAVIVDKRKLSSEGFGYKKSFYKFLNRLLYKDLFRTFPSIELYVDEHGSNDFMREFKKYVEKHHPRNLFTGHDFGFKNSENSYFIQIADFVAGTLGYIYDEKKKSEHSPEFEKLLSPVLSGLNFFPSELSFEELEETNTDSAFDPTIAQVSLLRIQDFLEKERGTDQLKSDQIGFLKLLLIFQRTGIKNRYVPAREIFEHLEQNRSGKVSPEYFRTDVVGALRDKGILIASSRAGYKIPTCAKDLESFINHGKRIILPMISRIEQARKTIKLATNNDLDLLAKPEFAKLKKLLDS